MNIQYVIEDMAADEAYATSLIEKECFTQPWSQKAFEEERENPQAVILVAKSCDSGEVIGFVNARVIFGECYINNVAVTASARGQGVGKALMRSLIERAKECEFITLEVRPSNKNAIALYKGLGFLQVGIRKNFYSQPTEDAMLMTLTMHNAQCTMHNQCF